MFHIIIGPAIEAVTTAIVAAAVKKLLNDHSGNQPSNKD